MVGNTKNMLQQNLLFPALKSGKIFHYKYTSTFIVKCLRCFTEDLSKTERTIAKNSRFYKMENNKAFNVTNMYTLLRDCLNKYGTGRTQNYSFYRCLNFTKSLRKVKIKTNEKRHAHNKQNLDS